MIKFLKQVLAAVIGVFIGGILLFFFFLFIAGILISSLSHEEKKEVSPNSILMIDPSKPIDDRTPRDPFQRIDLRTLTIKKQPGLNDLLRCIRQAQKDSRIKGIYLKLPTVNAGIAVTDEIRRALIDFKKSGKFVVAYADNYTQKSYFLATAADKIYMNPEGNFLFWGLSSEVFFLKGMLDKLGVEPEVIRHGKYKSATEIFEEKKMSPENREQINAYLSSIWNYLIEQIAISRHISKDSLNAFASLLAVKTAPEALKYRLIDSALYKDELIHQLSLLSNHSGEKLSLVTPEDYLTTLPDEQQATKNCIAVIYAGGSITMAQDDEEDNIVAEKLAAVLREVRKDSSVNAVVLRINSPGGSALASEIIWREVQLTSRVKPVVASMGNLAASGGYYILTHATTIITNPVSLTGSIGVFGVLFNTAPFLEQKLGITTDKVNTHPHADMFSMTRKLTPEEKQLMQKEIDRVYHTFVSHVSEGRKLPYDRVEKIAGGRVWTGMDACRIGLADSTGGLQKAIETAAQLAGLSQYTVKELPEASNKWYFLLNDLSGRLTSWFSSSFREQSLLMRYRRALEEYQGIQMRLLTLPELN